MTHQTAKLRPQAALLTLYGNYLLNRHSVFKEY